jgi:hypothetical protein
MVMHKQARVLVSAVLLCACCHTVAFAPLAATGRVQSNVRPQAACVLRAASEGAEHIGPGNRCAINSAVLLLRLHKIKKMRDFVIWLCECEAHTCVMHCCVQVPN